MTGPGSSWQRIPIFNYHTVTDHPQPGIAGFAVRPDDLARHLDLIVARHCTALTISALVDLLDRDLAPPPATVVITFDDGYEDNLTVAAPLLVARGLPATVFVTTGFLPGCPGGSIVGPGPMLPWGYLPDLETAGLEVGSHSHTHPELDVLSKTAASHEIRHSKSLLEEALGHPVDSFAYPHGYATSWLQQEVCRAGFRSASGVRDAFSHTGDNRWLLSRLIVRSTTTCDQIDRLLRGTGAPTAGANERLRTKGWRAARRMRSSVLPAHDRTTAALAEPGSTDRKVGSRATPG
jgi:peptidoglycan/xylan/chitin deacetylase (PgdA/CDA1 family)